VENVLAGAQSGRRDHGLHPSTGNDGGGGELVDAAMEIGTGPRETRIVLLRRAGVPARRGVVARAPRSAPARRAGQAAARPGVRAEVCAAWAGLFGSGGAKVGSVLPLGRLLLARPAPGCPLGLPLRPPAVLRAYCSARTSCRAQLTCLATVGRAK
jgi:hypothetical protein